MTGCVLRAYLCCSPSRLLHSGSKVAASEPPLMNVFNVSLQRAANSWVVNGNPFRQTAPALYGKKSLKAGWNAQGKSTIGSSDNEINWEIPGCSYQRWIFLRPLPQDASRLLRPTNESELKMPRVIAGLKLIFDAFSSGMLKALVSYWASPARPLRRAGMWVTEAWLRVSVQHQRLNRCHPGLTFIPALVYLQRNAKLRKPQSIRKDKSCPPDDRQT